MRYPTTAIFVLLLLGHAGALRAQTINYGPGKIAEVREKNRAGDEIQESKKDLSGDPAFFAVIGLGNHSNAFGESTAALAYVDNSGTFWGKVNADNNNPPYQDWGNGEANTTLAYSMHKSSGVPSKVELQFTGGHLALADYGGGSRPLEAAVLLTVTFKLPDVGDGVDTFFATLSGRGGSGPTETFDWSQQGFDVTEADYSETGDDYGNINAAALEIPAQLVSYNIDELCDECDFEFWVELHVFANNPGGETKAYAYFRDPVHIDDPDPDLGGAGITYEGVTLLPVPEPSASAGSGVALSAALLARRVRRAGPRAASK